MHKYRLVAKKGEGTFSEVLKAQCIKNGKYVAIKCMKVSGASQWGFFLGHRSVHRDTSPHTHSEFTCIMIGPFPWSVSQLQYVESFLTHLILEVNTFIQPPKFEHTRESQTRIARNVGVDLGSGYELKCLHTDIIACTLPAHETTCTVINCCCLCKHFLLIKICLCNRDTLTGCTIPHIVWCEHNQCLHFCYGEIQISLQILLQIQSALKRPPPGPTTRSAAPATRHNTAQLTSTALVGHDIFTRRCKTGYSRALHTLA